MNQTSKNGKKTSSGHDFGPFGPNSGRHFFFFFFFSKIWLRRSLDIMISQKTQKKKLYITDQLRDDYPNP